MLFRIILYVNVDPGGGKQSQQPEVEGVVSEIEDLKLSLSSHWDKFLKYQNSNNTVIEDKNWLNHFMHEQ